MDSTTKGTQMLKYTVDLAFDDTLEDSLEDLARELPSVWVRVIDAHGPGGGWPVLEVLVPESDSAAFETWYSRDDVECWREELELQGQPERVELA